MTHRRGTAQWKGLVAACVVGVVLAGVFGTVYVLNRPSPGPVSPGPTMDPPPSVTDVAPGPGTVAGAGKLFVQVVDPQSPSRVQAEITADRSEPLPNRRVRMDAPRAWFYLRDGRSVYVEAARGQATTPDGGTNSRPEDASLDGDVIVRLFEAVPGANRPERSDAPAVFTLRTARLRLDAVRGELEIPEVFTLESGTLDFKGRHLLALFNEGDNRLESLVVTERVACTVRPGKAEALAPAPARAAGATTPPPPGATVTSVPTRGAAGPRPAPGEALYHATFTSEVVVSQGRRTLRADQARAWVRLVENALPAGAIAPIAFEDAPEGPRVGAPDGAATPSATEARRTGEPPTPGPAPTASGDVEVAWSGPLEIVPVTGPAPELDGGNHVFVRMTSDRTDGVVAADAESGATATGRRLDYAATKREASLLADPMSPAMVMRPTLGVAKAARFDANFGTGVVRVPVAGTMTGEAKPGEPARTLVWTREAEASLVLREGRLTGLLREARLVGGVEAKDASGSLAGNAVTATFETASGTSTLKRLQAVGAARAADASGGVVTGEAIDARFARGEGDEPRLAGATISGGATASKDGGTLRADRIEAFVREGDATGRVDRVEATGHATYADDEGQRAASPRIEAWPGTKVVTLRGSGSTLSRGESSVAGEDLRLDGVARTLDVTGPGTGVHRTRRESGDETATLTWTDGLRYDDVAEAGSCAGEVAAVIARGALDGDRLHADTVAFELATTKDAEGKTRRELAVLRAVGGSRPATLEAKRHRAGSSTPSLERMLYLEGATITANQVLGTLDVPGRGKLLAVDHSPRDAATPATASSPLGAGDMSRGTALFSWGERFTLRRAEGRAEMEGDARLIHDRGDGSARTQLDADSLHAAFRERGGGTGGAAGAALRADLTAATARGNVRLLSGTRELRGERLTYDAEGAFIDALSEPPRLVSLLDSRGASPVRAQSLRWYLRTDRVEVTGVRPVTAPR